MTTTAQKTFDSSDARMRAAERRQNLADVYAAYDVAVKRLAFADVRGEVTTLDSMREAVEKYRAEITHLQILSAGLDAIAIEAEIAELTIDLDRRDAEIAASDAEVTRLQKEAALFGIGSTQHTEKMRTAADARAKLLAAYNAKFARREALKAEAQASLTRKDSL